MKSSKHIWMTDLAKGNPGGLDDLKSPHNFSNNPGFMGTSTGSMLSMARPGNGETGTFRTSGGGVPRATPMRRPESQPNPTLGRTAMSSPTSVANPAPGSVDPGSEGNPLGRTSGYSG